MYVFTTGGYRLPAAIMAVFFIFSSPAHASCGAAYCPVNTQWNTQGIWTEPGWRADLRYEFVPQTQPRTQDSRIAVGQIRRHHDEVRTINQNLLATLDYGFSNRWGVSVALPFSKREHTHIHNHGGSQFIEQWDFTEMGDTQLMGRYQLQDWNKPYVFGLYFGTKLPTGKFTIENRAGDRAERTLQPGTGTIDGLVGFYLRQNFPESQSSWFMQAILQQPFNERDEYKPGESISLDIGYRYDISQRLSLMLQLNNQYKDHDSGQDAEARDSGGHSISLSPGISYGLTETVQLYSFVQKPVYQYVNGVQITPEWSVITGISLHF
jgi:hypothetical protein